MNLATSEYRQGKPTFLRWMRGEVLHFAWRCGLYHPPDRRVLEHYILGSLASDPAIKRVLFVGVQWYTKNYSARFEGKIFATIDPRPSVVRFGGNPHKIGRIQDLSEHFPEPAFDAIIINGVIGFGLNNVADVNSALDACRNALRHDGWLILGINELAMYHIDPAKYAASRFFESCEFGANARERIDIVIPFLEQRHTYLFWRKKNR